MKLAPLRNFHTGKENTISFAMMSFKTRNHTVVVAIYFGTTYSDYAFSIRSDFLKDKHDRLNRISTDSWNCDDFVSDKTPTTLLLDKDKKFVSFGYNAENDYSRMTEEKRKDHYYFRRFKMMLYNKDGKLGSPTGISKKSLLICLEPEAAAIYCKWLQMERDNEALDTMKPGLTLQKCIVLYGVIPYRRVLECVSNNFLVCERRSFTAKEGILIQKRSINAA
uniref:Uncharacterized protein n=1 Tax=Magallana gigas TaxID=29159 RepID=A0A8W8IRJ2_MAGGI